MFHTEPMSQFILFDGFDSVHMHLWLTPKDVTRRNELFAYLGSNWRWCSPVAPQWKGDV